MPAWVIMENQTPNFEDSKASTFLRAVSGILGFNTFQSDQIQVVTTVFASHGHEMAVRSASDSLPNYAVSKGRHSFNATSNITISIYTTTTKSSKQPQRLHRESLQITEDAIEINRGAVLQPNLPSRPEPTRKRTASWGMSAYTPLEALLLFQYVSNYGLSSGVVFNKVSAVLKKDKQISKSTSYDLRRLNPDALRDFFLQVLRDSKSDVDDPLGLSRKRKVPSPTNPNTLDEAVHDIHLLPPLIRKLYARYREHETIEIRESERKYAKLKKELEGIESGAWNERLQKEFGRGEWDHVIRREKAKDVEMGRASDGENWNICDANN